MGAASLPACGFVGGTSAAAERVCWAPLPPLPLAIGLSPTPTPTLCPRAEKENGGKGKAPVAAAPSADEGGSQGGEEGEEDSAAAGGDLQLAWENLEAAKVIWSRDAAANAQQLAGACRWQRRAGACAAGAVWATWL